MKVTAMLANHETRSFRLTTAVVVMVLFAGCQSDTAAAELDGRWTFQAGRQQVDTTWELTESGVSVQGLQTAPVSDARLQAFRFGAFLIGWMSYDGESTAPSPGLLLAGTTGAELNGVWLESFVIPTAFHARRDSTPPPGPNRLIADGFESGTPSTEWTSAEGSAELTIVKGVARSGQYAARIRYTKDEQGASFMFTPIDFATRREIYIRYWQMFPQGYNQVGVLKQARIFRAAGHACSPNPGGDLGADMAYNIGEMGCTAYRCDGDEPVRAYIDCAFPAGEWVKIAVHFKYNTPGSSNGLCTVWRNDQVIFQQENIKYTDTISNMDGVWVGGNYSGQGRDPVGLDRYLDDIYIGWTPQDDVPRAQVP